MDQQKPKSPVVNANLMLGGLGLNFSVSLGLIFSLLFSYGAAKLSYDRFRSIGWAVLAFLFSGFYYPYYVLFVSTAVPAVAPVVGMGRRR